MSKFVEQKKKELRRVVSRALSVVMAEYATRVYELLDKYMLHLSYKRASFRAVNRMSERLAKVIASELKEFSKRLEKGAGKKEATSDAINYVEENWDASGFKKKLVDEAFVEVASEMVREAWRALHQETTRMERRGLISISGKGKGGE